jgi:hypothetical protein
MDANEYATKVQPATKSLGVVIRAAQWLGKGQAKAITTEATVEPAPPATTSVTTAPPSPLPEAPPESEPDDEEESGPSFPLP